MTTSNNIQENKYNDVINQLHDYMLNDNTIKSALNSRIDNILENSFEKPKKTFEKTIKERLSTFSPKQKDSLFWCFYILKYGETNYEMLENINIVLEKKLKMEYGKKSSIPYKIMNKMGVMKGNKTTAKGRAMEKKHEADTKNKKRKKLVRAVKKAFKE